MSLTCVTKIRDNKKADEAARRIRDFDRLREALALIGADYTATESHAECRIEIGDTTFAFTGWSHRKTPGRFVEQTTWRGIERQMKR